MYFFYREDFNKGNEFIFKKSATYVFSESFSKPVQNLGQMSYNQIERISTRLYCTCNFLIL